MIAVSIVLYKTEFSEIERIIHSCSSKQVKYIFLIDNSPTDQLAQPVKEHFPQVIYIAGHGNIGYGKAHNIAIRRSIELSVRYHLVVNADVYFEPQVLEQLAFFMDTHTETALTMPLIKYPDGKIQYLCKLLPTPADLLCKRFLMPGFNRKRMEKYQLLFSGYKHIMNVPCLSGCFMFLRIESLQQVGLFDERFFMYGEDVDLSRRLHAKYPTLFYPQCTVWHVHARHSYRNIRMLGIHMINMYRYFMKWGWYFDRERDQINNHTIKMIYELTGSETFIEDEVDSYFTSKNRN